MTIFVTWQSRVTLDSIRNSCDVFYYMPMVSCLVHLALHFRCYTTDPDVRWEYCPDLTCSKGDLLHGSILLKIPRWNLHPTNMISYKAIHENIIMRVFCLLERFAHRVPWARAGGRPRQLILRQLFFFFFFLTQHLGSLRSEGDRRQKPIDRMLLTWSGDLVDRETLS